MSTKPSTSLTNKVDIDHFIGQWLSQKNISYQADFRSWMIESYENPLTFWSSLFKYYQEARGEVQSELLKNYNFYHDCVLKHLKQNAPVLRIIHPDQKTETFSYDQLHQLVEAQAASWREKFKIEAGQTVAIILPQGIHFLVGLITAIRLGLIVCVLPLKDRFLGSNQLITALEQLKPDHIITTSLYENPLNDQWATINIDLSIKKSLDSSYPPHTYLANDIIVKAFDPYRISNESITLVEANTVYLNSVRDGLFALSLKLGTTWARPLSSMLIEEPFATLTALLAGATLVHISDEVLQSDPYRIKEEPIEILEVSALLQKLWICHPGCPSEKLKLWYKNPLLGNIHEWTAFSEINKLQTIPTSNLMMDSANGGLVVFSQPKPIKDLSLVHPSLGAPWTLLNLNGSGEKTLDSYGIFQKQPFELQDGYLILAQIGNDWMIYNTTIPTKEGVPYPIEQVEEVVELFDFVELCMVLPNHSVKGMINNSFILMIFITPRNRPLMEIHQEDWSNQVQSAIKQKIGEAFVPDSILFYALYPKMKEGAIDRNWVRNHYENGLFARKERSSVYHSLNLLRQSIYEKLTDQVML